MQKPTTNRANFQSQRGASMLGILVICVVIILIAVLGLKLTPAYIEHGKIKQAVSAAKSGGKTVNDVRKAFERYADVNDITTVKKEDIEVTKEGNDIVVIARYDKKIPLFYNVYILIEFLASSNDQ